MLDFVTEYRIYFGVILFIASIAIYAGPSIKAAGVNKAASSLHAALAADMPSLKAAEQNMLALGRESAEIVRLFETQIAKRISEAKAKQ